MSLEPGTRIGPYEVLGSLGAGGMGEVYRARDTRLGRDVAIKVLPDALTSDGERLGRFEREARMLAALNHPHIGAIYGLEDVGGGRGLILELVEGPTLAEQLARGRLSIDEALPIARQIAEALEAAHDKGIVHRDLKPANIKVRPDGTVKVLDFGLAKIPEREADSAELSRSPTMMTAPGMILGTAAYMSPEQIKGSAADRPADVWAFGCVLYEMLSGYRAFDAATVSEIVAAVLKSDPDWQRLPADTPEGLRRLLERCLRKDVKRRLRDIRDARLEIEDVEKGPPQKISDGPARSGRRERLAWVLAVTGIALAVVLWGTRARRPVPIAPEARLEINTPPGRDSSLAISPDGQKIVFVARSGNQLQLWLRSLDSSVARPLSGTEGGTSPFWSPDSRSIAFFADRRLRRVDIDRGSVTTLLPLAPSPLGGTWTTNGIILCSTSPGRPIVRVSAESGEVTEVTRFDSRQQRSHSSPRFLPDGRRFLFYVAGTPEVRGVYVGQLDTAETKRLFDANAAAEYSSGHLLFVRDGQLLAQPFDSEQLETRGDPFPITQGVSAETAVAASASGLIAYRAPAGETGQRQLVWVDRSGRELEKAVYTDSSALGPALSHDGRHVAVHRNVNSNMDIWSYDRVRRVWDRLTFDVGDDIYPLWSSDDRRIVFGSRRGEMDLYWKLLTAPAGSGEELLVSSTQAKFPMDWSRDGRFVLFDSFDPARGADVWAAPLAGDRKPFEVVQTDYNERAAQFSPDGRWIAYQSDKTGRFEIYVRPFPAGGDSPVSTDGGAQVRWHPNGSELFYIAADDRLMAVPIRFSASGETIEAGHPVALFPTNVGGLAPNTNRQQYAVSRDGQSFLLNTVVGELGTTPITVILNWRPTR